jgi:hypothetical protein
VPPIAGFTLWTFFWETVLSFELKCH